MPALAPELDLLCAAVRRTMTRDGDEDIDYRLLTRVNWDHVLWLGRQHGVLLFLAEALTSAEWSAGSPPEICTQLKAFREVSQLRLLARAREISQLQDVFDTHSIPAVPVDRMMGTLGPAGQLSLVEIGTAIPYLVPAGERDRAKTVLVAAGYTLNANVQKLVTIGKSPVVLNQGLGRHPLAARLLAHTGTVTLGGRSVRTLSLAHRLLHRAADYPLNDAGLMNAWRIAKLASEVSEDGWLGIFDEARLFGLDATLSRALQDSHRQLHLPVPPGALRFCDALPAVAGPSTDAFPLPAKPPVRVVFLPTPLRVMDRMLELARPTADDVVYDLGCGDGRFVIQAARLFGARGVGIDIDPLRIAEAQASAAAHGVADRVSFVCGDIFETDLSQATIICLYLMPPYLPRLYGQMRRDCRPGLRVVSHDYIIPGWPPEKTEIMRADVMRISQIYLWRLT